MKHDPRWVLVFLLNLVLILLTAEANHWLSPLSFQIFTGGLLLGFPVLRLNLKQGLLCTAFTGFFFEVGSPLPHGSVFLAMMACHVFLFSFRGRFARETLRAAVLATVLLNLALFSFFAATALLHALDWMVALRRLVWEAMASSLLAGLASPWVFAMQISALRKAGIDLDAEQREAR